MQDYMRTDRLSGTCETQARTLVQTRDVSTVIDEPLERGGSNQGPSPTEMLMASLLGCINVIAHNVARRMDIDLRNFDVSLECDFDRRGVQQLETVAVPFVEVRVTVNCQTSANSEDFETLKADVSRFCPITVTLRAAGCNVQETWNVQFD